VAGLGPATVHCSNHEDRPRGITPGADPFPGEVDSNTMDAAHRSPTTSGRPARARALALALATALLLGVVPVPTLGPGTAAADSAADIPGVPMPAGVATGRLGGDIYDVVYRIDVEPGSVILASLSGPVGTDFDLYLFDASATTVVANLGVVARSTGATSDESISYATATGGRFYVDLNSATEVAGTYTLAVQVVADRPPVASLALNAGRPRTNETTVSASLTASGSLSAPARMAFSADGVTWEPWQPYQAMSTWTFPVGDGAKTLWARIESAAGVPSAPVSASVVLDTERPGVTVVDPPVGNELVGRRPPITVTFSEPIDPASWTLLGLIVQTPKGELISGTCAIVSPTSGAFHPSQDLVAGAAYVLSVGAVRDVAGNLVAPLGSWVAVVRPAPELTLAASPRVVNRGASALLGGRLAAPAGVASLTLEAHPAGALTTIALGSVPVAADGRFSVRVTPSSTTEYRVRVPATGGFGAGSASAVVAVRRSVQITGPSPAVTRAGRVGARTTVAAAIAPVAAGVAVAFRLERWSTTTRAWRLVGTLGRRTDAAGRASVAWTPSGSGLYRWRATAASTLDYSTAASAWVRWSIGR